MAEPMHHEEWIPEDTFGARLALVRQHFGWNVKEAAEACGLVDQSWRNWEAGKVPRDVYDVALKVARRTGVDRTWLLVGGPLAGAAITDGSLPTEMWVTPSLWDNDDADLGPVLARAS